MARMCKIALTFACLASAYDARGVQNSIVQAHRGPHGVHVDKHERCCSSHEAHPSLRSFAHLSRRALKALTMLLLAPCVPTASWQITGHSCHRLLNTPDGWVRSRVATPMGQSPTVDTGAYIGEEVKLLDSEQIIAVSPPGLSSPLSIKVKREMTDQQEWGDETGNIIWPAGKLLLSILSKQDLVGRHVLELGSGTGIGALGAAAAGAVVTATDGPSSVLQLIKDNSRLNGLDIRVGRLFWGDSDDIAAMSAEYDLIIGSDILYGSPHEVDPLLETIAAISTPGRTEILFTFQKRLHINQQCLLRPVVEYFSERAGRFFELVSYEEPEPNLFVARWLCREL